MKKEEKLKKFHERHFSWSQISSFTFSPEQWYKSYILGEKQTSEEMEFGSRIGKKLETDPTYMPEIPRYGKDEYAFKVMFNKICLVGYADSFNHITCKQLGERKTGKNKWDKFRVDNHGQLTMYCLMNYIQNKIKPEDVEITLSWIPTSVSEDGNFTRTISIAGEVQHFKTKRTMKDILNFGNIIILTYKMMEKYVEEHS